MMDKTLDKVLSVIETILVSIVFVVMALTAISPIL